MAESNAGNSGGKAVLRDPALKLGSPALAAGILDKLLSMLRRSKRLASDAGTMRQGRNTSGLARISDRLTCFLFALITAGPVLALVAFDAVPPYGSPHPGFPALSLAAMGEKGTLDGFGEAILHRSSATVWAIQAKNYTSYYGFGFINMDFVVSGSDGWLYYKEEFRGGRCLEASEVSGPLAQIDVMREMAEVGGLRMVVSLSPDKSTIYPEHQTIFTRQYWGCKTQNARLLRQTMAIEAPRIVDHLEPLLAEKSRNPTVNLYYLTDTHWTLYGAFIALHQLVEELGPDAPSMAVPKISDTMVAMWADILNNGLLLPYKEITRNPEPVRFQNKMKSTEPITHKKVIIIHDSFYYFIMPQIREIFPRLVELQFTNHYAPSDTNTVYQSISSSDILIVNSVERFFLERINHGGFSWQGSIGQAILRRNGIRSEACAAFQTAQPLAVKGVAAEAGGWRITHEDPHLVLSVRGDAGEGHLPCLRLEVEAPSGGLLEVFLPREGDEAGGFHPGRTFRVPVEAGRWVLTYTLPGHVAGRAVRVDPGLGPDAPLNLISAAVGWSPLPEKGL